MVHTTVLRVVDRQPAPVVEHQWLRCLWRAARVPEEVRQSHPAGPGAHGHSRGTSQSRGRTTGGWEQTWLQRKLVEAFNDWLIWLMWFLSYNVLEVAYSLSTTHLFRLGDMANGKRVHNQRLQSQSCQCDAGDW